MADYYPDEDPLWGAPNKRRIALLMVPGPLPGLHSLQLLISPRAVLAAPSAFQIHPALSQERQVAQAAQAYNPYDNMGTPNHFYDSEAICWMSGGGIYPDTSCDGSLCTRIMDMYGTTAPPPALGAHNSSIRPMSMPTMLYAYASPLLYSVDASASAPASMDMFTSPSHASTPPTPAVPAVDMFGLLPDASAIPFYGYGPPMDVFGEPTSTFNTHLAFRRIPAVLRHALADAARSSASAPVPGAQSPYTSPVPTAAPTRVLPGSTRRVPDLPPEATKDLHKMKLARTLAAAKKKDPIAFQRKLDETNAYADRMGQPQGENLDAQSFSR